MALNNDRLPVVESLPDTGRVTNLAQCAAIYFKRIIYGI